MQILKAISTLKCQICDQGGLIPMMPAKGMGRRVVVCSNEFVTHYRANGQDYLVQNKHHDLPELILN